MEIRNYYFTYGAQGKSNGQDYDGGHTFVHAPDFGTAITLFHAIHPRKEPHIASFSSCYTEQDMKRNGWDEEHFGTCHDAIIYNDRKE